MQYPSSGADERLSESACAAGSTSCTQGHAVQDYLLIAMAGGLVSLALGALAHQQMLVLFKRHVFHQLSMIDEAPDCSGWSCISSTK